MKYQTRHITQLYDISHQTVKDWCEAFADFLSPTATPGKGRQRHFTEDDLQVFSLVSEVKRSGGTFEDARAALATGQRGGVPDDLERALMIPQNISLTRLRNALEEARAENQALRDELMQTRGENRLLQRLMNEQLERSHAEIRTLFERIARLEAGGG